jgi:hypothetical protein
MSNRTKQLSRRNFLLASGAATAATAAAIVATKSKPVSTGKDADKRETRGYQASEHVSNYYRTTKV